MIAVGVGVPANAPFQVVNEHDPGNLRFDAGHLGIDRSDDLEAISKRPGSVPHLRSLRTNRGLSPLGSRFDIVS
jgi:hypothetical protein